MMQPLWMQEERLEVLQPSSFYRTNVSAIERKTLRERIALLEAAQQEEHLLMVEARHTVVEQEKVAQMQMGARRGAVDGGGGKGAPAAGLPATASTPAIEALRPSVALHELETAQLEQAALRLWKVTESHHRVRQRGDVLGVAAMGAGVGLSWFATSMGS
ncbi:hypothetical protein FOA52_003449 [Chlamydomonas sp. UWO 241]|nr:hypothetical protein FOA52_003449 [Chlamydomonas sp. UWO 241]